MERCGGGRLGVGVVVLGRYFGGILLKFGCCCVKRLENFEGVMGAFCSHWVGVMFGSKNSLSGESAV